MSSRREPVSHRGPGLARTVAAYQSETSQEDQSAAELQYQLEILQAREVQEDMSRSEGGDLASQIQKLGLLHQQGFLTAEEFAAAKEKFLDI